MKKLIPIWFITIMVLVGCSSNTQNGLDVAPKEEVHQDVIEYLDAFESSVDNYVAFLEKYYAMDTDGQLRNIGPWTENVALYNENCQKLNDAYQRNDESGYLNDADKAYWMQKYLDCTMKVLEAYDSGDAGNDYE